MIATKKVSVLEALRAIGEAEDDSGDGILNMDGTLAVFIIPLGEALMPPSFEKGYMEDGVPEPNCDDPECGACMMLRTLRGTTIESDPGIQARERGLGSVSPQGFDGPVNI